MSYQDDRKFADRYNDRLQMIAAKATGVSQIAPVAADLLKATDFQLLWRSERPTLDIAGRVRRPIFRQKYPYDITFRYERKSSVKTEWQKIVGEGYADYMVYAIAADDTTDLIHSVAVLNLHMFRAHLKHHGAGDRGVIQNRDGATSLRAWDLQYLAYCRDCLGMLPHQEGLDALDTPYLELMTKADRSCETCGTDASVAWGYPWFRWLCKPCFKQIIKEGVA